MKSVCWIVFINETFVSKKEGTAAVLGGYSPRIKFCVEDDVAFRNVLLAELHAEENVAFRNAPLANQEKLRFARFFSTRILARHHDVVVI